MKIRTLSAGTAQSPLVLKLNVQVSLSYVGKELLELAGNGGVVQYCTVDLGKERFRVSLICPLSSRTARKYKAYEANPSKYPGHGISKVSLLGKEL